MFVIKHNSGLYLYHREKKELRLLWMSQNAKKEPPWLFKTGMDAHNFIHDHQLGKYATVQQVVKDNLEGEELDEMLWLVKEIEGLAVKVIPFYPVPQPEEVILSTKELIFEF